MGLISTWMARTDRQMALMGRMVERLGVDTARLYTEGAGTRLREVVGRCRHCPSAAACRDWLDAGATGTPRFCANALTFERLRAGGTQG
jgi:hypothetical protein